MNTVRRAAARVMEAVYNLLVALFGSVFQGPATDEHPPGASVQRFSAAEVDGSVRHCVGLARLLLAVGGPSYRIAGTVSRSDDGDRFIPNQWWRDRGATEVLVRHS